MIPSPRALILPSLFKFPAQGFFTTLTVICALAANFLFASGHDQQRCIEIVALCVIATVFFVRAARGKTPAVPMAASALLLTFLTLGLASVATAYSLRHAVNEWSNICLLLLAVFAIAAELADDRRRFDRALQWVGIACAVYSLRLLVMYLIALASGFQMDLHSLAVSFSNVRFLNHTQTALLPLIVLLFLQAPGGSGWRKMWWTLTAFWWALLFVSEARATLLALLVGCVTVMALRRSHAREFIVMMMWTALVGLFFYATVFVMLPLALGMQPVGMLSNVMARTIANPSSDRNLLWTLAWQLINAHPWLGIGPQHFAHEGARLYAGAHPHDWMLQIAAEWGIPALLCLLGTIILGLRALIRSGARLDTADLPNQQILVSLLVACTAIFVDSLFSGVLVMPQSRLAIVLVLAMASGWVRLQSREEQHMESGHFFIAHAIFGGLVAAGLCGLIWSVAPDIGRHARGEPLSPAEQAINPGTQWPRMWGAGFF